MRLIINFSQSFEKTGSRLIGRYDDGMSGDLPGFVNKMHWKGM